MANDNPYPYRPTHSYIWDGVEWIKATGSGGGPGTTIADGADVAEGATGDAAVVGDNSGTLSAKLRGINKILANVWDSVNGWLKVSVQNTSLAITGTQANNAVITANPLITGAEARQDQGGTNAVAGRAVQLVADRNGRLLVISPKMIHADSSGTPITTATTTDVTNAPAAGYHLKIYRLHASNSSGSGTWVYWLDAVDSLVYFYPVFLAANGAVSIRVNGEWELSTASALQLKTSAVCNIEWHVAYEGVKD